jgi:hypothetical protein
LKELSLMETISRLTVENEKLIKKNSSLAESVSELTKGQYQPRMERLKLIENSIKDRMMEYALAEERLEVWLDKIDWLAVP